MLGIPRGQPLITLGSALSLLSVIDNVFAEWFVFRRKCLVAILGLASHYPLVLLPEDIAQLPLPQLVFLVTDGLCS